MLKKRFHFFFVKNDNENEIFMLNTERIQNLKTKKYINL